MYKLLICYVSSLQYVARRDRLQWEEARRRTREQADRTDRLKRAGYEVSTPPRPPLPEPLHSRRSSSRPAQPQYRESANPTRSTFHLRGLIDIDFFLLSFMQR